MASSPRVFEVMIHRVAGDAAAASMLRQRLGRDGIRAGVADFAAAGSTDAVRVARHLLVFVGAAFDDSADFDASDRRFDFVFVAPEVAADAGSRYRKRSVSYDRLRECLANGSEGGPISAFGLRRATRASYDAIATQFTDVWFDAVPREAIETLLTRLPRGGSILDAGCGPGHHARFLKQSGFDPVGLDFSRAMLRVARKKNPHIPFIEGDLLSYPLPKARFSGVWSAVALNHVPAEDVPGALENLVGTLESDGFIGLNFQVGRPSEVVGRENDHRFFEYPADEKEIVRVLESLGVRVVATHFGTTSRNIHGLDLEMRFATVVGRKAGSA